LIRRCALIAVSFLLTGCLTFDCPACADAGADASCAAVNAWPGTQHADDTACSSFDAGPELSGGEASAACSETGGGDHTWGLQSFPVNAAVNQALCARVDLTQMPAGASHVDLNLHCAVCVDGGVCGCEDEPGLCVAQGWSTPGVALTGPFQVPAGCTGIVASLLLSSPSSGTLAFDDAWVWIIAADAGCDWNAALQCPAP
jgi:hypothetical protein